MMKGMIHKNQGNRRNCHVLSGHCRLWSRDLEGTTCNLLRTSSSYIGWFPEVEMEFWGKNGRWCVGNSTFFRFEVQLEMKYWLSVLLVNYLGHQGEYDQVLA